ncbi:hypothetical protein [Nocardioides solisilvae]|uniref:hypothetical protein n=1 Tax=Nocardioides solisilvae TaxID=1542435 RepID=UPI000D7468BE|nr:hypothetical protein [Nocardioides solisilvae]
MEQRRTLETLDLDFGPEPPMPALGPTLAAGRRALFRRRLATGAAALAVVGVLGAGWASGGPRLGADGERVDPAGSPTEVVDPAPTEAESPSVDPASLRWGEREVGRYVGDELVLRPDATVHERIDDPYATGLPHDSVALDATVQGERGWFILALMPTPEGGTYSSDMWSEPSRGWADFAAWVDDQVGTGGLDEGFVQHAPGSADIPVVLVGGTLVALEARLKVVEQVSSPGLPESFAPPGTPTGAGIVEVDGERTFVLLREVEHGKVDVIDGGPPNGRTLDQLVTQAREAYVSGEGLR